jgi:hypothetical protein
MTMIAIIAIKRRRLRLPRRLMIVITGAAEGDAAPAAGSGSQS